jgi:nitrogen fixation/metabolism regulation signal transduction histidine kinase
MKLMANPIVFRAAFVFICAAFSFLIGMILIRKLRHSIAEEAAMSADPTPTLQTLPLNLYNTVIQQLKQQKHELQVQSQAEHRRARATETFSQAVLSNLSCGVLVFGNNGLVQHSNPAAREILGFASTYGMGATDIFRGAAVWTGHASTGTFPDGAVAQTFPLADEVQAVLQEGSSRRQVETDYVTPAGVARHISVTISPIASGDGSLLGAACLVTDLTDFESMRRIQALQAEVSAEMALSLRTSLATITGYAQQLAANRDPHMARQIAQDIADEAAQLDQNIGGFLTGKTAVKAPEANALGKGAGSAH